MKTLSVLSLSILLAACGGSSSSSDDANISKQEKSNSSDIAPPTVTPVAGYDKVLENCGDALVVSFDDLSISGSLNKMKTKSNSNSSDVRISGDSNIVCIEGSVTEVSISGSNASLYVNGSIGELRVSGFSAKVVVFGGIASAKMSGDSIKIYTQEVATIKNIGDENSIMNISNANL